MSEKHDPLLSPSDRDESAQGDELFIVELDERLEFGVAAIASIRPFDTNSGCTNSSSCGSKQNSNCHNGASCLHD